MTHSYKTYHFYLSFALAAEQANDDAHAVYWLKKALTLTY